MIRQRIEIMAKGKPWHITAFYPVTCYHVREIMAALYAIDCNHNDLNKAFANLSSGQINNGLTFSNYNLRETVVVLAKTSDKSQFFNLISHELHHIATHIGSANGLDLKGEEVCYISGDVAQAMYPICRQFLCSCSCACKHTQR